MRWMAGLSIAVLGACGFSAPNGAATGPRDGGTDAIDALFIPDGLIPPDAPPPPIDAPPPAGCVTRTVEASRTYGLFGGSNPGTLAPQLPYTILRLPGELPVTSGNAGNHCAAVELTRTNDSAPIRCRYQGGASVGATAGDFEEFAKGLRYVFQSCWTGEACPQPNGQQVTLTANEEVSITGSVVVRIHDGDRSVLFPTVVRVGMERCSDSDMDGDSDE